jgi:hypothetical protein
MDVILLRNISFRAGGIHFRGNKAMSNYLKTKINMLGCVFNHKGEMSLLKNSVEGKEIDLTMTASVPYFDDFWAKIEQGNGVIRVEADLKFLKN